LSLSEVFICVGIEGTADEEQDEEKGDDVFFAGRRRHTISKRDWSSDVCSSDLSFFMSGLRRLCDEKGMLLLLDEVQTGWCRTGEIGRASCRGRVERSAVVLLSIEGRVAGAGLVVNWAVTDAGSRQRGRCRPAEE